MNELPDLQAGGINAFGLTVSQPDEIMHGATLGWPGWHQQLELWMRTGFLSQLVDRLLAGGFTVCLSADHGNLESIGIAAIQDGVLAERKGQRVRVYPNTTLRNRAHESTGEAGKVWDSALLPEGFFPLFAAGRGAFVTKGDKVVAHGGASLDELLVPWVTIRKGDL